MARFSVGGDEDENEERPNNNNNRPLPKRLRISNPTTTSTADPRSRASDDLLSCFITRQRLAAAREASVSDSGDRAAGRPRVEERSEGESSDGSENDSSSGTSSEEESGGEEVRNHQGDEEIAITSPIGNRESESPSGVGPVAVTLTDPDVLDCPICFEPLCSPVYQCENGHLACALCCTKMRNKCANCSWPIGYNRCRAIEKVIESVRIACRNTPHGCMETLNYSKKLAHEKTCNYAPCSCPHIGCEYIGMSKGLYAHFTLLHSHSRKQFDFNSVFIISLDNNQKHVFLQERSQNVLFVLNRSIESVGSFVSVVCVAPTTEKRQYSYDITANVGESSIKLKSYTECMPKWSEHTPAKIYLPVPRDFVGATGQVHLALNIWSDSVNAR